MNEQTVGIAFAAFGAVALGVLGVFEYLAWRAKPRAVR